MPKKSEYFEQSIKQGVHFSKITPLTFLAYREMLRKVKNEPPPNLLKTPYEKLNSLIDGFEGGRLYAIGAPPKQGKTVFTMSLMYGLAKMGQKTLMFSYEVGWKEVIRKIAEMEEYDKIEPGTVELPFFMPLKLHEGGGKLQLQWLREAFEKAKKEGIKLITIDHLHFLIPYQMTENFSIVVGNVVREIKRLAVDFELPVILIVPMKNLQQTRKPTYWDIRDSSMIMHEADDIMVMYREKKDSSKWLGGEFVENEYLPFSVLSLELSRRRGATGKVILQHNGAYFVESDETMLKMAMEGGINEE